MGKAEILNNSMKIRINEELRGDREQAEDMLENIYAMWCAGSPVFMEDLLGMMTITKWEYKRYINRLQQKGFVENSGEELEGTNPILLTAKGKELGAEIMKRHQYLKGFLKAVCNVDDETADYDACRIEHVISDDVLEGIRSFMKTGSVSDRIVSGHDLSEFYSRGIYNFDVTLYTADSSAPRMFCDEFYCFGENIRAEVGSDSYFYLKPLDRRVPEKEVSKTGKLTVSNSSAESSPEDLKDQNDIWYMYHERWNKAIWTEEGFKIPSDIFVYTISGVVSVMSGEAKIAFTEKGKEPSEEDIRIMNVHLW